MSGRVTRSQAKRASGASTLDLAFTDGAVDSPAQSSTRPQRKRKNAGGGGLGEDSNSEGQISESVKRPSKRKRASKTASRAEPKLASEKTEPKPRGGRKIIMSDQSAELPTPPDVSGSKKKPRGKRGSSNQGTTTTTSPPLNPLRRSKNRSDPKTKEAVPDEETKPSSKKSSRSKVQRPEDWDEDDEDADMDAMEQHALYHHSYNLQKTLRALSGMQGPGGGSSRFRELLVKLSNDAEPGMQHLALQELSEILLMSNEDNLAGAFQPDAFIRELIKLMQPNAMGEENPEVMLLACRCVANMMEALPQSTANVVYGGAVAVLCQKLLEIHYIDVAEQALSTLEKISVEFPSAIVKEGGLTACLTYLDFFPTATQRSSVTTAANCCRNISDDSFEVIRDVMPVLTNVLNGSDQRVVEQGCLCVSRIVESFRFKNDKLEQLLSTDLLKVILRLLLPGSTNIIGHQTHVKFLEVLAYAAKASPQLATELLRMNVVDTLYQTLTGVSPPQEETEQSIRSKSVVIMQALIHRPRDQIFETLNVICELLPGLDTRSNLLSSSGAEMGMPMLEHSEPHSRSRKSIDKRIELFKECKAEVRRFAMILLPTLTDAYTSTVNYNVRHKVLMAQLKMLVNIDTDIIKVGLTHVSYASFLASILSQQDNRNLVLLALTAGDVLLKRLEPVYRHLFYREGVIAEIEKLAKMPTSPVSIKIEPDTDKVISAPPEPIQHTDVSSESHGEDDSDDHLDDAIDMSDEEGEMMLVHEDDDEDDGSEDEDESDASGDYDAPYDGSQRTEHLIRSQAQKFLDLHEAANIGKESREKADFILDQMKILASEIEEMYPKGNGQNGHDTFIRLAAYFSTDPVSSISSYELSNSNFLPALATILSNPNESIRNWARTAFLEVFMIPSFPGSTNTPFSTLIQKLQDLLSRAEHFEVHTIYQNASDAPRQSAAAMLAKQLRLRLDFESSSSRVPTGYRQMVIAIHAIATFRTLSESLRPRFTISDGHRSRSHRPRPRTDLPQTMAAIAALTGTEGVPSSAFPPGFPTFPTTAMPDTSSTRSSVPSEEKSASRAMRLLRTRSKQKGIKLESPEPTDQVQPEIMEKKSKTGSSRHRSRRQPAADPTALPVQPSDLVPAPDPEVPADGLECADETHMAEEDDSGFNPLAFRQLAGDPFDPNMEAETPPEPAAVPVEVGSTGHRTVSAPSDGLLRHARTLFGGGLPSRLSDQAMGGSPSAFGAASTSALARSMSYAAALQTQPQDYHLEFSIGDQVMSPDATVYGGVHKYSQAVTSGHPGHSFWSAVHPIKVRRVEGPHPVPTSHAASRSQSESQASAERLTKEGNQMTTNILQLLAVLHIINAHPDEILEDDEKKAAFRPIPASTFVNTKLTAKMNRQMEEPLIVASECLPQWSHDLALRYPFLFPFETRHLFLQSTCFGYARLMTRWQASQDQTNQTRIQRFRDDLRPLVGRLQRQKVRISRSKVLESSLKVMELYGASPGILEVEYFEEVGTGLGPTLEFFASVSKEFALKKTQMWRDDDKIETSEYVFSKRGLFPAPLSSSEDRAYSNKQIIKLFNILGRFVARSMLDSRIIDITFNPVFFRLGNELTDLKPSLGGIRLVDKELARSLKLLKEYSVARHDIYMNNKKKGAAELTRLAKAIKIKGVGVDDLGLDFTLPGYPEVELVADGAKKTVDIENVDLYLEKVVDYTLGSGVQRQIDSFRNGFTAVFPYTSLKAFTSDELVMLFGRSEEDWSMEMLMDSIKADHGFNMDSKSIKNLLQIMSSFDSQQRRDFLQFVTGSPKLPIGGFKSLTPMFTVVCKPSEAPFTSDDYLPSVMTCVNYLKLPNYSTLEVMEERMNKAMTEGQGAFLLS